MARYTQKKFAPHIYQDWAEIFKTMDSEQRSEVLMAIACFPNYDPKGVPLWSFFKSQIENQYAEYVRRSEISSKNRKGNQESQEKHPVDHCQHQSTTVDDGRPQSTKVDPARELELELELERELEREHISTTENLTPTPALELYCEQVSSSEGKEFPYDSIVEKWNTTCTTLPKVSALSQKRKEALKARDEQMKGIWKEGTTLENFERLFKLVMSSNFLSGRFQNNSEAHKNFRCTFDWVINPNNLLKVIEGNYVNQSPSTPAKESIFNVKRIERENAARNHRHKEEEEIPAFFTEVVHSAMAGQR